MEAHERISKKVYRKSDSLRLVWDDELQAEFERIHNSLGSAATASVITAQLQKRFPFIRNTHVSSHLQKYRMKHHIFPRRKKSEDCSMNQPKVKKRRQPKLKSATVNDNPFHWDLSIQEAIYGLFALGDDSNYSKNPNGMTYSLHVQCQ